MNVNSKAFALPRKTKRQRKLDNGMSHATKLAYSAGHSNPVYRNIAPPNTPVQYAKVQAGTPYVNGINFA